MMGPGKLTRTRNPGLKIHMTEHLSNNLDLDLANVILACTIFMPVFSAVGRTYPDPLWSRRCISTSSDILVNAEMSQLWIQLRSRTDPVEPRSVMTNLHVLVYPVGMVRTFVMKQLAVTAIALSWRALSYVSQPTHYIPKYRCLPELQDSLALGGVFVCCCHCNPSRWRVS